jgi:hypothetical protein
MKRKRHSPEQIIAKPREADALLGSGASIGQVCQQLQVSEPVDRPLSGGECNLAAFCGSLRVGLRITVPVGLLIGRSLFTGAKRAAAIILGIVPDRE